MVAEVPRVGEVFGRLTVRRVILNANRRGSVCECRCSCGNTAFVTGSMLIKGRRKSCGCLQKERGDIFVKKHRQRMRGRGPISRRSSYERNDDIDEFLGG